MVPHAPLAGDQEGATFTPGRILRREDPVYE